MSLHVFLNNRALVFGTKNAAVIFLKRMEWYDHEKIIIKEYKEHSMITINIVL